MIWKIDGNLPLYLGLASELRVAIIRGIFKGGDKLPGVRELASDAKVNPNTMQRALCELEAEGLIITRGTSGKFVAETSSVIAEARGAMLRRLSGDFIKQCRAIGADLSEIEKEIEFVYQNGDDYE